MEGRKRSLTDQASVGAPNLCGGGGGRLRRRTVRAGRFSTDYDPPVEIHASLASALNAVVSANGTDLALSIGAHPLVRLDGTIRPSQDLAVVDDEQMAEFLRNLLGAE